MTYETSPPKLLTVEEVAEALHCGRTKAIQLIGSGEIKSVKIDGMRRVPVQDLVEYIDYLRRQEVVGRWRKQYHRIWTGN